MPHKISKPNIIFKNRQETQQQDLEIYRRKFKFNHKLKKIMQESTIKEMDKLNKLS